MDWSLAKYESTDWWKMMRQMKIKTPEEKQRGKEKLHLNTKQCLLFELNTVCWRVLLLLIHLMFCDMFLFVSDPWCTLL